VCRWTVDFDLLCKIYNEQYLIYSSVKFLVSLGLKLLTSCAAVGSLSFKFVACKDCRGCGVVGCLDKRTITICDYVEDIWYPWWYVALKIDEYDSYGIQIVENLLVSSFCSKFPTVPQKSHQQFFLHKFCVQLEGL